jgi:serine/threonine-protein kinase
MDLRSFEWQWQSYVKVSDRLGRILDKMLEEKPKNRYQSAQEVLAELQHFAEPGVIAVPTPQMEFYIEIDQARKDRQVAEILETDYFQELQRQAEELRNSAEIDPAPQPEAEVPNASTLLGKTDPGWPSGAVKPETHFLAATPPKLNPAFLENCRQELTHHLGPIASYILDETLDEHPNIHPTELVEALAAEIPNFQQAKEFRNSVNIDPET